MSRSGYSDDCDNLAMYRGVIASATRGKRGQAFFRALVESLDAMPVKRLVAEELQTTDGEVCALGALGKHKAVDMQGIDTYDHEKLGATFDIAHQLACETMWENDEGGPWLPHHQTETPEHRWSRMRAWAEAQIRKPRAALVDGKETR